MKTQVITHSCVFECPCPYRFIELESPRTVDRAPNIKATAGDQRFLHHGRDRRYVASSLKHYVCRANTRPRLYYRDCISSKIGQANMQDFGVNLPAAQRLIVFLIRR